MTPGDFVPRLASELRVRLIELEQERLAITTALRALEPASPSRRTQPLDKSLLELLRASPGSRASLLALELGLDSSSVTSELRAMEETGEVTRAGMGWEVLRAKPRRG